MTDHVVREARQILARGLVPSRDVPGQVWPAAGEGGPSWTSDEHWAVMHLILLAKEPPRCTPRC